MKIGLLLAAIAATTGNAQRFDLVCGEGSAEAAHYRVDLATRRWCWDDCASTDRIAKIEPHRITFKAEDTPSNTVWNWVDRSTGEWFQGITSADVNVSQHSTCAKAPFSGFPKARNKF